jgi:cytochrome c
LDGDVGAGPPLNGVVGRKIGSYPGFGYSDTLSHHDGAWTRDALISFLTDPDRNFKGTKMPLAPISWTQIPNIITFLETIKPGGLPSGKTEKPAASSGE